MDKLIPILNQSTPWFWYFSRATGILAYLFLWFTIFLGLAIRNPKLKKYVTPASSFSFHSFVAATATFWVFVHATSLLFDKAFPMTIKDVFLPFHAQTALINSTYLALGIMAFYGMLILTLSSYFRKHLNHMFWRVIHFLNPVVFAFVVFHGLLSGTDLKNNWLASIYMLLSLSLVFLYGSNMYYKIRGNNLAQ